jgi:hypothetical protein
MSCVLPSAVFSVSVDLELDPMRSSREQPKSLETTTRRLLKLLDQYHLPATWAVADPAVSAATETLLASETGHEVAVLGEPTWVGSEAGRMRFGRELARRVAHGRAAGLNISTLALRGTELTDHLDLLVKHGISVLRGEYREMSTRWFSQPVCQAPAALRFGLWDIPASYRLPGDSRWKLGGGGRRRGRKGIDAAIADRSVFHLQVDALEFTERGHMAEHALECVLKHAALRKRENAIEFETLSGVARKLAGERTSVPARSILHAA